MMETQQVTLPPGLLALIEKRSYEYTSPKFLYHAVWLWGGSYCGVFGDGPNGSYEWFVWNKGILETSDFGYGSTSVALRDVLLKMEPK